MENWKMLRVKYAGGSGAMASQSIHHSIACSEFLGSVGLFFFFFFYYSLAFCSCATRARRILHFLFLAIFSAGFSFFQPLF